MPESQNSAPAPATSAAPMTAHSLRPVMNEPGMTPMPWKKKTTPARSANAATMRTASRTARVCGLPFHVSMYLDIALLLLRVVIGGVVMMHGLLKLGLVGKGGSIAGVAGWFNSIGLRPGLFWAYVAVLAEAGGSLLTVLGLGGPIGPGVLAGDLVVVTIVAHWPQGFWAGGGKVGWEFPVPLAAGGLAIALAGNGAWSLDRLLGLVYPDWLLPVWLVIVAVGVALALGIRSTQAPKAAQP
jgi:putative oxidoreductase